MPKTQDMTYSAGSPPSARSSPSFSWCAIRARPSSSSNLRRASSSPRGPLKPPPPTTTSSGAGTRETSSSAPLSFPASGVSLLAPGPASASAVRKGSCSASTKAPSSASTKGPTTRRGAPGQRPTCVVVELQAAVRESCTRNSGFRAPPKACSAQISRVVHGTAATLTLPASPAPATAPAPAAAAASAPFPCSPCSGAATDQRRMPSSSGKAERFSRR
mmetsp:Transcript_35953/g.114289  ORF Transcript_35953/g.114289 Transcript_35953/m.114289 type:complete len:218 (+) Transcript_35953:960-1613(+)